jgi:hypothetical protein
VHQLLSPFKLGLKLQVYNVDTYELVASAEVSEHELKEHLANDCKSHLLEGSEREELAKYLIQNSQLN